MRLARTINPPLIGALLVNGLMLMALIGLGVAAPKRPDQSSSLKVIALAVVRGEETAEAEKETPSPPVPMPRPSQAHTPPVTPVMLPALPPPVIPLPAIPLAVGVEQHASPPSPGLEATRSASPGAAVPATGGPRKGARDGANIDAPSGESRSYAARVRSWLLSHKTYPKRARMRRQTGIVVVHFIIDRRGRLIHGAILSGSGHATLDEEVMAMLQRASPYPAAPQDLAGERIDITAPVEFLLPV